MIWHPLLIAVIALDILAAGFLLYAAVTQIRLLLSWQPEKATAEQVALEGAAEGASVASRYGLAFFSASTLLLVVGISLILPPLVSGAMCGTGVLTSMGSFGQRALVLRALALGALWVWRTLDALDRSHSRPPAVLSVARWQLLGVPLMALAAVYTLRAILQLDPHQPVDCCQTVYSQAGSVKELAMTLGLSDDAWLWAAGIGVVAIWGLALWGLLSLRKKDGVFATDWLLFSVVFLWLPAAAIALTRVFAGYHYEVLHHHCPWCLFLPEHSGVGYVLLLALLVVLLETLAVLAASSLGRSEPLLTTAARDRQRRGLRAIILALVVYVGVAVGPAIIWRLTHGVWMHG